MSPSGKELKVIGKILGGSGSIVYYSEDNIELAIHDSDWCGTYHKTSKEIDGNEFTGGCEIALPYQ